MTEGESAPQHDRGEEGAPQNDTGEEAGTPPFPMSARTAPACQSERPPHVSPNGPRCHSERSEESNPESTEGVGRVSVLKRQEGAPLNLG